MLSEVHTINKFIIVRKLKFALYFLYMIILPPLSQEMARFRSQTTLPTTFCEVTYDSDWLNFEDDRHLTPYRYSLVRNDTDTNSDTVSLTLPSYTYYEYLKSLYDCRTTPSRVPPGYAGQSGSHISQQGRSVTWHAFNKDNGSELSRQGVKSEPTKIRPPTYPFPSLHLIQGGDSGDELEEEYVYTDRTKEKLVWVDALNKWVPQKRLHPRPYMSFVGNAPVLEKQVKFPKEIPGGGAETEAAQACERFELHMGYRTSVSQPHDKSEYKQLNNEKRQAIRKRAQELAEQRKHRKAYSTPLYTSITERKQNMKTRVQSGGAHSSLPVSPIQNKEKVPSPKQVWLAEESPKLRTVQETKVVAKKEISITLMSQPSEDEEKDLGDEKDKLSEKKVPFTQKPTSKPKKKTDKDEDSESNQDADKEMKLQEKRLIESLEKQRQLQMLEQQKLLAEEQRKEKERKEKERLAEEERLRKMKESHSMQKQPLTTQNQNHDNYYENTMNAAGQLFSQTETADQAETNNKQKTEEQSSSKIESISSESKNNLKNSKIKENTSNDEGKVIKIPKITEKAKVKNNQVKSNVTKKPQTVKESSEKPVKIMDGLKRIEEGLEREGTDDSVKVTQGKRRKGKGKSQTKLTIPKTEKSASKLNKSEEEKEPDNVVNSVKYVKPAKPRVAMETDKIKARETDKIKAREPLAKKLKNETKKNETKPAEQTSKVVPKPKPEPPSKPILAGMRGQQKSVPALSHAKKTEKKEEQLPVTKEVTPIIQEKPKSPANEKRRSIIVKKERRDGRSCVKKTEEVEQKELPEPDIEGKKLESWLYDDADETEKASEPVKGHVQVDLLPSLSATLNPELIEKEKQERKEKRRKSLLANLTSTGKVSKKWRKPGTRDSSYADELRRLELAEERRKKQMEMFERLKNNRITMLGEAMDDASPRFEDYGFLAKYCIFTKGNIEMYRHAFDAVDEGNAGWLEGEDVMIALRGINSKLTEAEEEYLYRVLELTGFKLTSGADFKVFSVLAALSQRISALDKWMKNLIGQMDFKALEMKMFKCRTLWECNVDKDTNTISIDQLCVDLRAGGVSYEHETEVREKLAHLHALDLLDFLTYIPLFIMIHESVVKNPLDNTRNK